MKAAGKITPEQLCSGGNGQKGLIKGRQQQRIPSHHFGLAWQPYDGERFEATMKRLVAEFSA